MFSQVMLLWRIAIHREEISSSIMWKGRDLQQSMRWVFNWVCVRLWNSVSMLVDVIIIIICIVSYHHPLTVVGGICHQSQCGIVMTKLITSTDSCLSLTVLRWLPIDCWISQMKWTVFVYWTPDHITLSFSQLDFTFINLSFQCNARIKRH